MSAATTEDKRARALAVLEAAHTFPGAFAFTVIARAREGVTAEIRDLVTGAGESFVAEDFVITTSSGGKYVSHRMTVRVPSAEGVLDLYERFRAIEGVVQLL